MNPRVHQLIDKIAPLKQVDIDQNIDDIESDSECEANQDQRSGHRRTFTDCSLVRQISHAGENRRDTFPWNLEHASWRVAFGWYDMPGSRVGMNGWPPSTLRRNERGVV
jgi:hypothetical protein